MYFGNYLGIILSKHWPMITGIQIFVEVFAFSLYQNFNFKYKRKKILYSLL